MAKSKEQKRKEAMERLRAKLPELRQAWVNVAYGTSGWASYARTHGTVEANHRASVAEKAYLRACEEARCDRYGNPLENT